MSRRRKNNKVKNILTSIICLVLGVVVGFAGHIFTILPDSYSIPGVVSGSVSPLGDTGLVDVDVVKSKDLSIHFIELGNKYTGDCTLVKVGDTEMLIDAGSKASSVPYIKEYIDKYCTDETLEFVVVTHAHEDHYAGFATNDGTQSLLDYYRVETLIEFSQTYKTEAQKQYANYIREKSEAVLRYGTNIFTATDCLNGTEKNGVTAQAVYTLGEASKNVSFEILYQKFYDTVNRNDAESENNFSVCLQISQGEKKYLFTGDLEEEGELSLLESNQGKLSQVELYKAGHHGSGTSSSKEFMNVIKPKVVCVCCCAGSSQYTSKNANQFPTQEFINNVTPHTNKIFVTTICINYSENKFESFNGSIVICSNLEDSLVNVYCSKNTTTLTETDWFKNNRTLPSAS